MRSRTRHKCYRAWRLRSACVLTLVAAWVLAEAAPAVHAQPPEPWSAPEELSTGLLDETGRPLSSALPALVADPWGIVHIFWTQLPRDDGSQEGVIYYSRWDGSSWSAPVDVLYSSARSMRSPSAVVDEAGRIRLAWTVGSEGPVWYSIAAALQAGSAQAWSMPVQVTEVNATGFGLAVDPAGRSHIVYCTGGDEQRCFHSASSGDNGWTSPVSVHSPCRDCAARVAIDGRGRIHAIFGSQSTGGQAMYYSRSEDGGRTWLAALELDRVDDRFAENYGPSWGTVISLGKDQVHLIWFGAPAGQRWHCWSNDGGNTWSEAQQVSPDQRGLTLPVAAAFDSSGVLHVVSMGWRDTPGWPSGPFHMTWQGGTWSEPRLIGSRTNWDAEYAALTIARGNRLVAAWTDKKGPKESFQIWASALEVDAPAVEPLPLTSPALPSALPQAPVEAGHPSPTPGRGEAGGTRPPSSPGVTVSAAGLGTRSAQSDWLPYLLGVLPPLILLSLVLTVRASRQRRGG